MSTSNKARLTRAGSDVAIKPEAFLRLYEQMPNMIGEIVRELAENGDLESCRAALASGILEKPEAPQWSYAVLPLAHEWDGDKSALEFVDDWLKATGGDKQERLDARLLGEKNVNLIDTLMVLGARIGPQDSNGENALEYAINQGDGHTVAALVYGCNTRNILPMCGPEKSVIERLASLNDEYSLNFVKQVLGERSGICDVIRLEAGRVAAELKKDELKAKLRLSLMSVAKMTNPDGWAQAMKHGAFLKTADSEFFTNPVEHRMVIENMLEGGLSLNHRFSDAVTAKNANGVECLAPGTLLQAAAHRGNVDMIMHLLEIGADPDYKTRGRTARDFANSDQTKSAFDAFAAKKNIERVTLRSRIDAILYPPQPSSKRTLKNR